MKALRTRALRRIPLPTVEEYAKSLGVSAARTRKLVRLAEEIAGVGPGGTLKNPGKVPSKVKNAKKRTTVKTRSAQKKLTQR